jgi:hypothetical protein
MHLLHTHYNVDAYHISLQDLQSPPANSCGVCSIVISSRTQLCKAPALSVPPLCQGMVTTPVPPPSLHMIVLLCYYSLISNCYILNFVLVETCRTCHCYILPHFAYLRHMPVFCLYKSITVLMIPMQQFCMLGS